MSEERPVFKVTDRRLFNPDGTPRELPEEEPKPKPQPAAEPPAEPAAAQAPEPAAASQPAPAPEAAAPESSAPESSAPEASAAPETGSVADPHAGHGHEEEDYAGQDVPGADDPASFVNFLMSIASNAAASLGMMEHPATGQRSVDLELAKHWIDVLGMLQQKTRGNLAPQEQQIFEGLLADLRMQYVSLTSSPRPRAPRGFSGRDIIGGK